MSSQKGNVNRTRPQKHKNSTVFKNTKYDTSQRTKNILSVSQDGLCARCKDKIEWKVKYKKYKPLTQPANCGTCEERTPLGPGKCPYISEGLSSRCHQKTVKKAYYTVCQPCASKLGICAKCAQKHDTVSEFAPDEKTQVAEQSEMEQQIKLLSERERRTLFRLQAKGKLTEGLTKKGSEADGGDSAAQGVNAPECDDDSDSVEDSDDDEEKVDAHTLFE